MSAGGGHRGSRGDDGGDTGGDGGGVMSISKPLASPTSAVVLTFAMSLSSPISTAAAVA
eukprot:CAMPEP_0198335432 /NCGR_PEP_ID=MMETSP1450-20131203/20311_1 /TAXON_ID=753684 ORGANISM="Madagascaria erythrocladiodes, Strain CCMP3234" /NCGR_SAMPLE_ID=MMETSP1450 /ASSEMBLY_ACC=CAM_ASM_001115 /LENGTH=58 /DNA_ID=CAMNT_0044040093 /DNA_START=50 /DNA_END=226 /DNA_ORIENTATION=+